MFQPDTRLPCRISRLYAYQLHFNSRGITEQDSSTERMSSDQDVRRQDVLVCIHILEELHLHYPGVASLCTYSGVNALLHPCVKEPKDHQQSISDSHCLLDMLLVYVSAFLCCDKWPLAQSAALPEIGISTALIQ